LQLAAMPPKKGRAGLLGPARCSGWVLRLLLTQQEAPMSSPQAPLAPLLFTDAQHDAVRRAAAALHPGDREPFFDALAHRLRGETVGDGSLHRAIRDLISTGAYRRMQTVAVGEGAKKRPALWRKARGAGAARNPS
jgi:hypothetical protein